MSKQEEAFAEEWKNYQDQFPLEREFKFHPTRRWRADFVNHQHKWIIEVNGSGYAHGGTAKSLASDCERVRAMVELGYVYLPIEASMIDLRKKDPAKVACEELIRVLKSRGINIVPKGAW
jgi:very-short-patch-repair endonuclease